MKPKKISLQKIIKYLLKNLEPIITILFRIVFDIQYIYFFSPIYSYCGSILDLNLWKYFISWCAFLLLVILNTFIGDSFVAMCYKLLFFLSAIPSIAIFGLKNESSSAFFLILLYWGIWFVAAYLFSRRQDHKNVICKYSSLFVPKPNNAFLVAIMLWIVVSTIYFSARYGDGRLFVRFEDVYTYRLDAASQMTTFDGYLFAWNTNILMPLCLYVYLKSKCLLPTATLVFCFLASYAIGGNKIIFFTMIVVTVFVLVENSGYIKEAIPTVELLFLLAAGGAIFVLWQTQYLMPTSLVYRIFSIPAEAQYYYYDFFQAHEFLYLRQSILRWIPSTYSALVSVLIGSDVKYYRTGNYNNANNGCFADAYQNFGILGVVLYPIMIAFTLKLVEKCVKKYSRGTQCVVGTMICLYLYSAYFFSSLLTGGTLLIMVLYPVLYKYKNKLVVWRKIK